MRVILHLASAVMIGLLVTAEVILVAAFAPAPFPKPKKPLTRDSLVGTWAGKWGLMEGPVHLYRDGTYAGLWNDRWWVGTWDLNGSVLTITERKQEEDGRISDDLLTWRIHLDGTGRKGRLATEVIGSFSFSLSPLAPSKEGR